MPCNRVTGGPEQTTPRLTPDESLEIGHSVHVGERNDNTVTGMSSTVHRDAQAQVAEMAPSAQSSAHFRADPVWDGAKVVLVAINRG